MMSYYQHYTNGWRPSAGSGPVNAKADQDDQKPTAGDDRQEAEDLSTRT